MEWVGEVTSATPSAPSTVRRNHDTADTVPLFTCSSSPAGTGASGSVEPVGV
ncbi:hypothetical protein GBAR_LOCUS16783 [Geodia barretti]|uniref:Uncharacterized protein n=1 Tax=Geodia barretti TaxID=519541 RepID=A0AA35SJ52_GEOBA|nr:hypothetical protein GBAR_LOCUS16783 [Geodia barretti]